MAPLDLSSADTSHDFGARIEGLDLSKPLDDGQFADIHAAWMRHPVLVFSDQHLTPEQHLAFAERFGPLRRHTVKEILHPDYPDLLALSNVGRGGASPINNGGAYWHSDITYEDEPPMASALYGFIVPPVESGGDTLYADMTAAYDALDDETKQRLDGAIGVHTYRYRYELMVEAGVRPPQPEEKMAQWKDVFHPVVRTHPETGKKALFINEGFTARIDGWPEDESRAMLDRLFAHCTEDRFVYAHKWRTNDLVLWDNRCTMHCATPYDLSFERSMHRATVHGDRPY